MKTIKLVLSIFVIMVMVSACNDEDAGKASNSTSSTDKDATLFSIEETDCNWVGAPVKDCVVFEGAGDLIEVFKGPGRYAVRYLDTADWVDFNLYTATSYAFGSSSITVTDVNGVDMTDLYQITYGTYSTSTDIPVGQISSDVTLIYDVKGIGSTVDVELKNVCSWTGWC